MTDNAFTLRPLKPDDGPAYADLLAASPDTGAVSAAVRLEIDPYAALIAIHADTVGVVAEAPGFDGLAGGGLIRFGECQWEGRVRPYALLNTLVVRPEFRRRGLATQLARWRQAQARERFGDEGVIWALIQHGNMGSEVTARRWSRQWLVDRLTILPAQPRARPPAPKAAWTVRSIEPRDYEAAAEQANEFYRDYNLYPPETAERLAGWLAESPFDDPYQHYRVVVDRAGRLLAGLAVAETGRLRTAVITRWPLALRLMNALLRLVPASGVLRELTVSRVWFAPGQLAAAQYLWEAVRWEFREKGTSLILYCDRRSPALNIYGLRPWTITTQGSLALLAPEPAADARLFYYP